MILKKLKQFLNFGHIEFYFNGNIYYKVNINYLGLPQFPILIIFLIIF